MNATTFESSDFMKGIFKNSILLKVLLIAALILIMTIPEAMVTELVGERMKRGTEVVAEIGSKWGESQTVNGPLLSIPAVDGNGNQFYCHTYPEALQISTNLDDNERKRSIYKAVLYTADISMKARFTKPTLKNFSLSDKYSLKYDQALLTFGISDVHGIAEDITAEIGGTQYKATPGIPIGDVYKSGFHIPINITEEAFSLDTKVVLKGSESFHVVPSGKSTIIAMNSKWQDPSFTGEFLPNERSISEKGFDAKWNVHALQRNSVQHWSGSKKEEGNQAVGVKLLQTNSFYQKILRTIKYAILFLSFTFAAVFISERLTQINIHPLQYLLTGLASILFYVMLISLSEHLEFNLAYGVTTSLVTLLITAYAKGIFKVMKVALTLGSVSAFLYLFLFVTLQLEDYSLMMGSSGLFIILAVVMYLTRNINQEEEGTFASA